ncbi:MAG: patatin-like phospholipase family protein [Candidatus Desulfofervidaceae bacterium]|nr:patatin-like phospholipase family protein [Candidatus Desulfofervidaceae bacterium]
MTFFFKKRRKKIGLALGGGAARGGAHIGVLRAFQELGIPVDYVAGTSIGALVGGFFAAGEINSLENLALHLDWKDIIAFFDVVFPKAGLIDGKKVTQLLQKHIPQSKIEELSLPFAAVATDIVTGQEVILDKGNIIEAIRASISIPGIFTPVKIGDQILVDGGVVNPVPVSVVQNMGAEVVIAVDLNASLITPTMKKFQKEKKSEVEVPSPSHGINLKQLKEKIKDLGFPQLKKWASKEPMPNIFEIILSSVYIMEQQITRYRLSVNEPEVIIQPDVGYIGFLDFHRAPETIAEGYRAAMEKIVKIKSYARL